MHKILFPLSLVLMLFLGGCQLIPAVQPPPAQAAEVKSDRARSAAQAPATDVQALSAGHAAFALGLYHSLANKEGNLFFSPYSISEALAMTYAGARGETAAQMESALHFTLPAARLHPAVNTLDRALASRGQGAKGKDAKGFRLHIVNALWGQRDYTFQPDFLNVLAENYGAGVRLLDFVKAPEPSRVTINDWVQQQTEDRIKDLVPPGAIDAQTRMVLTNAIYFNAAWAHTFNKDGTQDGSFDTLAGTTVTVPLMHLTESFRYAQGAGYQALELPYDGNQLSMIVLLPAAGEFKNFESSLDAARLDQIVSGLDYKRVAVTLPRWKFETALGLKETLAPAMPDAFTFGKADFSGMDGTRNLYIGDVLHKAFVAVDEDGTEAAAATAVILAAGAMPLEPVEFKADRPFIFILRDTETGAALFVGRVADPKS